MFLNIIEGLHVGKATIQPQQVLGREGVKGGGFIEKAMLGHHHRVIHPYPVLGSLHQYECLVLRQPTWLVFDHPPDLLSVPIFLKVSQLLPHKQSLPLQELLRPVHLGEILL